MGEIADMMLDGTMDCETGEWNFDGEDGPGWPMTGAEAAEYRRSMRGCSGGVWNGETAIKVTKAVRKKIEQLGVLKANDQFHWQVRKAGKVVADWWPHKNKFRIDGKTEVGNEAALIKALAKFADVNAKAVTL